MTGGEMGMKISQLLEMIDEADKTKAVLNTLLKEPGANVDRRLITISADHIEDALETIKKLLDFIEDVSFD